MAVKQAYCVLQNLVTLCRIPAFSKTAMAMRRASSMTFQTRPPETVFKDIKYFTF